MIRSLFFACMTALIATFAANYAVAADIIETPLKSEAQLGWSASPEALPTGLHLSFSTLMAREPKRASSGSVLNVTETGYLLSDGTTEIVCAAKLELVQSEGATALYRCDFHLQSAVLDWAHSSNSVQAVLFDALDALYNKGGAATILSHEHGTSRMVRLVDDNSASKIVCEKRQDSPSAEGSSYRCVIDIRP